MFRSRLAAALCGALLLLGAAGIRAFSGTAGWDATPGTNPAAVALLEPSLAGLTDFAAETLPGEPLDTSFRLGHAVPDSGLGAAAVVAASRRVSSPGSTEEIQHYAYTWGRQWSPRLAAGISVRWESRRWILDSVPTPAESGPGVDLGAIYQFDERTWAEAVVRDAFETRLESVGGSATVLPTSLDWGVGREVAPGLSAVLRVSDAAGITDEGARWEAAARLAKGDVTWQAGLSGGASTGWSAGVTFDRHRYCVRLGVKSEDARTGGAVGVTVRW